MGTYLIQNPHHEYASRFIQLIHERYGHRPIAFFTRSAKECFYRKQECLPDGEFAAMYEVDPGDVDHFAARLRERHRDIEGIVPYSEETLQLTADLQERLGLRWHDPGSLARFRHKAALKEHLRRVSPSLRLNGAWRVASAAEVFALDRSLPRKFILKPDSGFGSRGIAVFTADQRDAVSRLFERAPDVYVLEEFLEGTLYAVDGMIDEAGNVLVASVFSSGRRALNGCPVVYANGALVHEDTPLFHELAGYAREVLRAAGLRRSPFHIEVMRDSRGPCLIEIGARLVGHSHAFTCERVHSGAFDFFGLAAAGYLGKPMDLKLSYDRYNRVQAVKVYGACEIDGLAYAVSGIEQVEALPSFDRWIVKPRPGMRLRRTVDLFTVPYSLVLIGTRQAEPLIEMGERVHRMLRIESDASIFDCIRIGGRVLASKIGKKLAWMRERARRSFRRAAPPA
jgi:ATP-grasp domain